MAKLPEDRPSARDTVARAQAAAAPKIARAQAKAGPAAEKAAANAGKLLGTLRDRAKTTLKEFSEAYSSDAKPGDTSGEPQDTTQSERPAETQAGAPANDARPGAPDSPVHRPRPRPRPTRDPDGPAGGTGR